MKVAIIKYGMGNPVSVEKALKKIGYQSVVTNSHEKIKSADFILLPGVGSFKKGMENLEKTGLANLLTREVLGKKKPFLGICLGMQLIASYGDEPYRSKGLGWLKGEVVKITTRNNLRIPHLGWNNVIANKNSELYHEFSGSDYYFIHSYHFQIKEKADDMLRVFYGKSILAALKKGNIYATQFHPEKSQDAGIKLLKKIIGRYA
jgi:imidazole glycerol-phosphate synthase subunit HisH